MASPKQTATPTPRATGSSNNVSSPRSRKRELDRRAQRNARERTKNRIATLERLVEDLQSNDPGGQVARLMKQLDEVNGKKDNLLRTVRAIQNLIRDTTLPVEDACADDHNSSSSPDNDPRDIQYANMPNDGALDHPLHGGDVEMQSPYEISLMDETRNHIMLDLASSDCDCSSARATTPPREVVNLWSIANEVLDGEFDLTPEQIHIEDITSEDIPIRAVLEGWNSAAIDGRLPPLWQKLRRIDELLFYKCHQTERLAVLSIMHLLLRYHAHSKLEQKPNLPHWYLARPSQALSRSYAINFFAWPGLRERFVFHEHRYCSNAFWSLFASNLHILWPYEFRDCYVRNVGTGEYKISTLFSERIKEINSWTMKRDIFKKFPEFYSDIPAFDESPSPVPSLSPISIAMERSLRNTEKDTTKEKRKEIARKSTHPKTSNTLWNGQFSASAFAIDDGDIDTLLFSM